MIAKAPLLLSSTEDSNKAALYGQKLWNKKLLPLQGDFIFANITQGVALGYELLPFQGEMAKPCFFFHAKPPGSFYLFTFLPFFCPNHKPPFSYLCIRNIKRKMKTYEKERNFATTLDRGDDDDAGSMCLFSTGG